MDGPDGERQDPNAARDAHDEVPRARHATSPARAFGALARRPATVVPLLIAAACAILWLVKVRYPPLHVEAQRYVGAGRLDDAFEIYDELLAEDPGDVEATVGLARALHARGELTRSLEVLEGAITRTPTRADPEWQVLRGLLLDQLGRHAEARAALRTLGDELPDDAELRYRIACSFELEGRLNDARDALEELLRRDPAHQRARTRIAWIRATADGDFADLRDVDRAEQLCLETLELDRGRTPEAVLTIVAVARVTGRVEAIVARMVEVAASSAVLATARTRLEAGVRELRDPAASR